MNMTTELPGRSILGSVTSKFQAAGSAASNGDIRTESRVDIERFMGDWYVIASIPTFVEKDAYNAVESYTLDYDGSIDTRFTFRKGGFDGAKKNLQSARVYSRR